MKTFDTFEQVADMGACVKRPIVVHAKKIDEENAWHRRRALHL